jgi:hypothetical protein
MSFNLSNVPGENRTLVSISFIIASSTYGLCP